MGARVRYDGTSFRITEVNILTRRIRMEGEGRMLTFPSAQIYQDPRTQRWTVDEVAEGHSDELSVALDQPSTES
mgnify:FL=1